MSSMYSMPIKLTPEECITLEMKKKGKLTLNISEIHSDVKLPELWSKDIDLELAVIRFVHPFEKVYKFSEINSIAVLDKINRIALKYDDCTLIKPAMSKPFNEKCLLLCHGKHEHEKIPSNLVVINHIHEMRRFISLINAYGCVCASDVNKYLKNREIYQKSLNLLLRKLMKESTK